MPVPSVFRFFNKWGWLKVSLGVPVNWFSEKIKGMQKFLVFYSGWFVFVDGVGWQEAGMGECRWNGRRENIFSSTTPKMQIWLVRFYTWSCSVLPFSKTLFKWVWGWVGWGGGGLGGNRMWAIELLVRWSLKHIKQIPAFPCSVCMRMIVQCDKFCY